jgi:pyruvate-ferredoxin/flavodoxin oxidoreductase
VLPGVLHVTARAIAAHALSIFGDHQDVMAVRQTGFACWHPTRFRKPRIWPWWRTLRPSKAACRFCTFSTASAPATRSRKSKIDYETWPSWSTGGPGAFRARGANPERPELRGTAQNPDIYFQGREAANPYYLKLPGIVADYMKKVSDLTGRTTTFSTMWVLPMPSK